ncbi:acyl carrier protein [Streptomyces uncialis]|uniref:Carrier domain-containing protein n=1 Tax=Streptomyces uncialis TaxID=1048205 RepID=A0A1Q4V2N8_9ACTN|nr:acyl carrier protein [Streptomyces uncialis]MCX4657947.1 acyl carrier protein [Streptomyces uncialis]OKH92142.1 hypothetical protein AB852_24585 [Streptomyces uncialis]
MATATEDVLGFFTDASGSPVGLDDDYFADGRANSFFAFELVIFVEHRFQLTVEAEDLDVGNFRTAAGVLAFVRGRTGAPDRLSTSDGTAPRAAPRLLQR